MAFYITTPIYYVNDTPHIGHSYTTVVADVLRRYRRLFGEETLFLTGVDEHGQKVQAAAEKRGRPPQQHCDELSENFKSIWKELGIDYDIFMRTTSDFHKKAVQAALAQLHAADEIYAKEYEGWYSQSEEIFYTEKDLVDGKTPQGNEVTRVSEKNYFFKMSKYQARLIAHIEKHPEFIQPDFRRNEVLGFLKQPLQDLCISRPKARLSWGIELPFDKEYVTYVWFDALLNYATGVGYQQPARTTEFGKWWGPPAVHLIGKDILTTHAVYWPTMLMALGAPLPRQIFAHGWWLTGDNEKMSKSKGQVVKPLDVKDLIGIDALRYFLIRDIRLGNDAQFSVDLVLTRVNSELANNIGNLLSRTASLIEKYFDGKVPAAEATAPETRALADRATGLAGRVREHITAMRPQDAVGEIVDLMSDANKFLADRAPWKAAKTDLPHAAETLRASLECLRIAGTLLYPVMPDKATKLVERLGGKVDFEAASKWGLVKAGAPIMSGEPLFPRIELPKEPPKPA